MTDVVIQIAVALGTLGLLVVGAHFILEPGRGQKASLFQPWRGDPWPHGIQEEEPVRFDLAGAERRRRARLAPRYPPIEETPSKPESGPRERIRGMIRRLRH